LNKEKRDKVRSIIKCATCEKQLGVIWTCNECAEKVSIVPDGDVK